MYTVKEAEFVRMANRDGELLAEVEVKAAESDRPLKVYLRPCVNGYEAVQVFENNADFALDWYDNSMHQAFKDLTEKACGDSESFGEQVVAAGNLGAVLEQEFHK